MGLAVCCRAFEQPLSGPLSEQIGRSTGLKAESPLHSGRRPSSSANGPVKLNYRDTQVLSMNISEDLLRLCGVVHKS